MYNSSFPQKRIRVLVVDDSSFMRVAIRSILAKDPGIEIVGTAIDGIEAVEKAVALKPDIITLDVEMPRLDGIGALKKIMVAAPTRVIMVSTLTSEGAKATFDALDAGAIDYISKNVTDCSEAQAVFREELVRKVKGGAVSLLTAQKPRVRPQVLRKPLALSRERIAGIAIGASTGGPVALQEVLSRIPATFPHGIMVGIHMPKAFTGPFAERLNSKCSISIKEAADGELLVPSQVLIAPGGSHATLVREAAGLRVRIVEISKYPQYIFVPSVDLLLTSMADATTGGMLGVILTGMGSDGFKGMKHLKELGGSTLVQDEASSTIYGMPRACVEGGVADAVLPLNHIGPEIAKLAG